MRLARFTINLLLGCILFHSSNAQVQTARYISMTPKTHGFYEYLPQGYNTSNKNYALIIITHGNSQRGMGDSVDLPVLLQYGLNKYISQGKFPASFTVNGKSFSFIVIAPQFDPRPDVTDMDAILNYVLSHYR